MIGEVAYCLLLVGAILVVVRGYLAAKRVFSIRRRWVSYQMANLATKEINEPAPNKLRSRSFRQQHGPAATCDALSRTTLAF